MNSNVMADSASSPTTDPHRSHDNRGQRHRALLLALGCFLVAGLLAACGDDGGQASESPTAEPDGDQPLDLDLGEGDALASCLPVDAETLSEMAPAFKATATEVDGETVTLTVDTWYAGADRAEAVELHATQGLEALIGGIDFQVGEQYLISATQGSVNYCGYSGPADATLTALFEEAFVS